jgi:hypothetical protein
MRRGWKEASSCPKPWYTVRVRQSQQKYGNNNEDVDSDHTCRAKEDEILFLGIESHSLSPK